MICNKTDNQTQIAGNTNVNCLIDFFFFLYVKFEIYACMYCHKNNTHSYQICTYNK